MNRVIDHPIYLPKIMKGSLLFQHGFSSKRSEKILEVYPKICTQEVTKEMIIAIPGFQEKTASQFIDNLANFKSFLVEHSYLKYYVSKASASSDISPQNQKFKDNLEIFDFPQILIFQIFFSNFDF